MTQLHPWSWKSHTSSSALCLIHEHGPTAINTVVAQPENKSTTPRLFPLLALHSFEVTFLDYSTLSLKLL